jgi:hypothetical protein
MGAPTYKLTIIKGKTLEQPMLYAQAQRTYVPIEAVVGVAPLRLLCTGHGFIDGWPVRIQGVISPTIMNTEEGKTLSASVVDSNTIEINALDASLWGTIDPSGSVVFFTPADLTGWVIRMQIRTSPKGEVLLTFSSDPADTPNGTITIDAPKACFTLGLPAAATAAITWSGGVYDIEGIMPNGKVVEIISTSVVIASDEVTVWA